MATTPKIKYDIEAAVSGGSDVDALATQLEGLSNTLEGDLKVQATAAAAALRNLGEKQAAISNFRVLKTEVQAAAAQLQSAQTQAQNLGKQIGGMEAPTRSQTGQLEKLRDEVKRAKTELQSKTQALDGSRAALRSYGISTDNLAQSERNVKTAIAAARSEVATMAPAYARAGSAAQASGKQQVQAATSSREELQRLGAQLSNLQNIAVTALGGTFLGSIAKDLAATADEFNNLQARVKLVTGEGEAFTTAWAEVEQIAQRTSSTLEGTAELFTRIAQAGKELGFSQQAALALTETINQSIQLSGGSAESAKAAITQLVQGLQSGVVRGEEFNSIMEQSPRLARALADGLGVTTGELRKLAEQGALTTQVVLDAVQGQSQIIAQEFETLPPTVGRAIQNLSTNWSIYVNEVDKATGASSTAASAINFLGQNLSTIAGYLIDIGQAAAGFAALRLAQTFLGIGTAAQAAAVQVTAAGTAMAATGAAATTAAVGVGRFAALLGTLKTISLIGIVTNFQDIGKWIGESAAKLAGYKDQTEALAREERIAADIARQNAAEHAAMAQAMEKAADKARGLSAEGRALVNEFDKIRTSGKSAADALEDLSKKANLTDTSGIQAYSNALQDLATTGKATGDQIREAFATALKTEDIAAFEVRARAALSGTKNEAEQLATIIDATLREAIRRSGADFAVLSGGMGTAARSAINDTEAIINGLDRLKAQGVDTAAALTASLGKSIKTADSEAAITALRQQIELVRDVLGEQITNGLLDQVEAQAGRVITGLAQVEEAFKRLGITTREDLQRTAAQYQADYATILASGQATAAGLQAAFTKYAQAAIAANDGIAPAALKAEAAMQGLEIATDAAGRATVRAMGEGKDAVDALSNSIAQAAQNILVYIDWLDKLEKRNAQVKSVLLTDKDGFAIDSEGKRIVQAVENRESAASKLQAMGVDPAKAKQLAASLFDARGNNTQKSSGAYREGDTTDAVLQRLATQNAGAAAVGRTVNVNLSLGGKTQTVSTDEAGAAALLSTLQAASLTAKP